MYKFEHICSGRLKTDPRNLINPTAIFSYSDIHALFRQLKGFGQPVAQFEVGTNAQSYISHILAHFNMQ